MAETGSRPVSQEISETSAILNSSVSEKTVQGASVSYSFETTSPGVVEEDDNAHIHELAQDMFGKTVTYLHGELSGTLDDYKLLEEMNRVTITKYSDMKQIAANVSRSLKDLNDKYKSLQPYLEQIEQIEASAFKLEQAAYKLDMYSKRLEAKCKQMEKR